MKLIREHIKLPVAYTVPQSAVAARNKLLAATSAVETVTEAASQALIVGGAREIRTHIKEVEAARKELAAPLNSAIKRLKALEDEHCGPLRAELDRVEGLLQDFQRQEQARVEAENRRRQEEFARLEAERQARQAEAAQALQDSAEQMRAEQSAYEASEAAREVIVAPLPEPVRAKGMTVKTYLRHEVTDALALFAARPDLCNPPTARPIVINQMCFPPDTASKEQPDTMIPGLKLWWEKSVETRSY